MSNKRKQSFQNKRSKFFKKDKNSLYEKDRPSVKNKTKIKVNEKSKLSKKNESSKILGNHDLFFKDFFSDRVLAQELMSLIFSKKQLSAFHWGTLKTEKDSFPDGKVADLVYSVSLKDIPKTKLKIFILLEHKSYYDKDLFTQLLNYQCFLRSECLKRFNKAQPIIPVLFYHGEEKAKWKRSLQEEDFRGFFEKIPEGLRECMLDYRLKWIDLKDPKMKVLIKTKKMKSRGVLRLLSEIWELRRNFSLERLEEILEDFELLFKDFGRKKREELRARVLLYLENNGIMPEELEKSKVLKKGGSMGLIEAYKERCRQEGLTEGRMEGRAEGRTEGLAKGRMETAKNLLKEKVDLKFIQRVTGLSLKEIKKLKV